MAEFSFTYRAFISYAHADHAWAVWLHRALERYRVPRRLAGAENLRRLGKMFRDEEELAAAAELGPKIDAALQASDVLIVVCSPRSSKSKWVNQEIEAFKRLGRESRVFALIVDGTPHGAEDECFPEALKRTLGGGVSEPLAVDVRKFGREDAALRLIAGMLDVGYDDLRQREIRRRRAERRRAEALFATGLALVAAALTGGWFAMANYVAASERNASLFAQQADTMVRGGFEEKAILMALAGDPAAQAGWAEGLLRPQGYSDARRRLAAAVDASWVSRYFNQKSAVNSVAISPDGTMVLLGLAEGVAKLLPIGGGTSLANFTVGGAVLSVAFSPDGKSVLTGSEDGTARLWSISGAARTSFKSDKGGVSSVAFSPDGTLALTVADGTAKLWSTAGGEALKILQDEPLEIFGRRIGSAITLAAFAPDGKTVLTYSRNDAANLWRVADGENVWRFTPALNSLPTALAFSSDGKTVAAGLQYGAVALFHVGSQEPFMTLDGRGGALTSVEFSPAGDAVVAASDDGDVTFWSIPRGGLMIGSADSPGAAVASVSFSPDGNMLLTGSEDGVAKLWRISGDRAILTLAGDAWVSSVAFSADRTHVLIGSGKANLYPIAGGDAVAGFSELFGSGISSAVISPDGKKVLIVSSGSAILHAIASEDSITVGPEGDIQTAAFSPDGKTMLTGSSKGVAKLWSVSDGAPIASIAAHGEAIEALAYSPDGTTILTGSQDGTAKLFSVAGREEIAVFKLPDGWATSVAFSPDGTQVLIGSSDGQARIWPVSGGEEASVFAHGAPINAVAFSPDGRLIMTGGDDGEAWLWPADGGNPIVRFSGHLERVMSVAFSTDGKMVLTGSADRTAKLWNVPEIVYASPKEQVRLACTKLEELGAPLEFSAKDILSYPILRGANLNPCNGVLGPRNESIAP